MKAHTTRAASKSRAAKSPATRKRPARRGRLSSGQQAEEVLERVSDSFVALDRNWRYTFVNRRAAKAFGRTPEQLIGKHIWTEFPEGVGQPFYKAYYRSLRTQKPIYLEEYYPPYNRWFENRIYPSRKGLSIFFHDITDRKKAELALRDAEQRLRRILRAANVGLWDWDLVTNRVYFSPEWKKQLGYGEDEIPNEFAEWEKRVHPDDLNGMLTTVHRFIEAPWPSYEVEFRLRHKDGSYRWILSQASLETDQEGKAVRMLGSHIDITEHKKGEQLLAAEKRILEMVARREPLTAILGSIASNIESLSADMFCTILLMDPDGVHVRHGAAPSMPASFVRAIDGQPIGPRAGSCGTAAYTKQPVYVTDIASDPLWADYKEVALQHGLRACWSTPIMAVGGEVLGTFAMYYMTPRAPGPDDTHLIELATHLTGIAIESALAEEHIRVLNAELELRVARRTAQLRTLNKELESFSYSVSHDLRAPLRAVSGFAEIVARRHREGLNDEGRHYVDNIVQASERMGHLIDDLLKYSRLGRTGVRREAVPLAGVLGHAAGVLKARVNELQGSLEIDSTLPVVPGDRTLLSQIFTNLLENAVTYRRPGIPPTISVTWHSEGDQVVVEVTDNGIGIAQEHLEKIFNVFQRLHSDDQYPGTGIGLATVKKSAELLGGNVRVTSTVGQGSTFSIILPAR